MKSLILLLILNVSLFRCAEENTEAQNSNIYGTWQLVETYVVDGVNGKWAETDNGYIYTFNQSGYFESSRFQECANGTFTINGDTLALDYSCEDFTAGIESPKGTFKELYEINNDFLTLSPSYMTCVEGCGYRFKRIAEPQAGD